MPGPKHIIDGDERIRRSFGLPESTDVVLPGRGSFLVTLRGLSESQAFAVLKAAADAGVDLGGTCLPCGTDGCGIHGPAGPNR